MNFKKSSDTLFDRISHAELAGALNVSVAAVRQARLKRTAKAYRKPPKDWRYAIILLAQKRIARMRKLIGKLKGSHA